MNTALASFNSTVVRLADGQDCHLLEGGQGRALMFVHGLPGEGADFLPLASRLAQRYRCMLLDRSGYGRSTPVAPTRPMTVERAADDVAEILEQLKLRDVVLIGWSYGAHVVAGVAAAKPDLIDRVVLLGAAGPSLKWPIDMVDRLLFSGWPGRTVFGLVRRAAPGVLRRALSAAVGRPVTAEEFQAFMDGLSRPGMIDNWLREGRGWQPSSMQPESIQQPCLMVHGDEDARVPIEVARETARRLPAGALREVAGSGHWPFLTHVEEVEREIGQFIG